MQSVNHPHQLTLADDQGKKTQEGRRKEQSNARDVVLVTHQLLFSCSIQYTTSCSRSRADLMGSSFAFSCSSIGNTYVAASMAAFELDIKECGLR